MKDYFADITGSTENPVSQKVETKAVVLDPNLTFDQALAIADDALAKGDMETVKAAMNAALYQHKLHCAANHAYIRKLDREIMESIRAMS